MRVHSPCLDTSYIYSPSHNTCSRNLSQLVRPPAVMPGQNGLTSLTGITSAACTVDECASAKAETCSPESRNDLGKVSKCYATQDIHIDVASSASSDIDGTEHPGAKQCFNLHRMRQWFKVSCGCRSMRAEFSDHIGTPHTTSICRNSPARLAD